ncbi:MAG: RICIN domain-containing protein, partial [Coriobacteriales bacterium]|nr:RICIN domain-containing protein [Coriobacteriales bacterium]
AAQLFQLVYNSSDGCYTVKNPHSSKVLDIPGNRAVEGQKPCQYTPNGTDAQRWRVEPLGSNRFRLYAAHSGLAMDAAAGMTANGTNVITWTPNGNNAQVWVLTKAA